MTVVETGQGDVVSTGSIRVRFDVDSVFLSHELPHRLRNSDMRVLDSAHGDHTYRVPPGLYSVEAMSPTGLRQSHIVEVVADEAIDVIVGGDAIPNGPDLAAGAPIDESVVADAVAPRVPTARPRVVERAPAQAAGDSGGPSVLCPSCAAINPSTRRFCRQCGSELVLAERLAKQSWWTRLRRRTWGATGERPEPDSGTRSVRAQDEPVGSGTESGAAATAGTSDLEASSSVLAWEQSDGGVRLRNHDVTLAAMVGCSLHSVRAATLLFRPDGSLDEPAHVTFAAGGDRIVISLPIDPAAEFPLGGAAVMASRDSVGRVRLVAAFTPERRVATVIDAMSGRGSLADSEAMVREASNLLLHKYADAPAAALGALMLQRLGRLDERESWVSNLARFAWLPDGTALYASLLRDGDDGQRSVGLDLLLAAAAQRPLFTDGLSLMISLLRRWPGDERAEEREAAIAVLGAHMVTADLDAVCLTATTIGDT